MPVPFTGCFKPGSYEVSADYGNLSNQKTSANFNVRNYHARQRGREGEREYRVPQKGFSQVAQKFPFLLPQLGWELEHLTSHLSNLGKPLLGGFCSSVLQGESRMVTIVMNSNKNVISYH